MSFMKRLRADKDYKPTPLDEEVEWITDWPILKFTRAALKSAPEYFWEVPSSSSGKYHPPEQNEVGGLVLHTKHAMIVAKELARVADLTDKYRSILYSAVILHDLYKCGMPGQEKRDKDGKLLTDYLHHMYPRQMLRPLLKAEDLHLSKEIFGKIMTAIEGHSGIWTDNLNLFSNGLALNDLRVLTHLADYFASRKNIRVELEDVGKDSES